MKTILVTGGAGFIGGTFVRQMIADSDVRVVNLDLLTYAGNVESLFPVAGSSRHVFIQGDIRDRELVRKLLEQYACDAVVHFAAESHVDRSIGDPTRFVQTNVTGTFHLLDAALAYWESLDQERQDAFRFLHVSTDEVYGSLGNEGAFREETPYAPNSPYSASKAASDHFVRAYRQTYGLPTLTTSCSNNYGPYQFPEKLIPLMILNAMGGKSLPVYGRGENVRDWIHVEDHCCALRAVLEQGQCGETYNIGGSCEMTNMDVVRTICRTVDSLAPKLPHRPCENLIQFVTDRPGHDFRYAIDSSKIQRELGWRPTWDFARGIQETVRWYIDNSDWIEGVTTNRYRGQRLGLERSRTEPASEAVENAAVAPAVQTTSDGAAEESDQIEGVVFRPLKYHRDQRGWLCELYREDELPEGDHPVMAYVSATEPGVARGPHEHVEQTDYFAFLGPGDFQLYLWDTRPHSPTHGRRILRTVGQSNPSVVIIPPGVVHAYKNTSQTSGWVFNAANRLYAGHGKQGPVDEIRHESQPDSPYQLDEDDAWP